MIRQLGPAVLLALLAWTPTVSAQEGSCFGPSGYAPGGYVPYPGGYGPEGHTPEKRRGPIKRFCDRLHRHSCGYGKTHHDLGCTGCYVDFVFVFGSCWEFFEEPCNRQPQPPPYPLFPR